MVPHWWEVGASCIAFVFILTVVIPFALTLNLSSSVPSGSSLWEVRSHLFSVVLNRPFLRQECFRCSYKYFISWFYPQHTPLFSSSFPFSLHSFISQVYQKKSLFVEGRTLRTIISMLLSRTLSSSWGAFYWCRQPPVPELCSLIIKRRHSFFPVGWDETDSDNSTGFLGTSKGVAHRELLKADG